MKNELQKQIYAAFIMQKANCHDEFPFKNIQTFLIVIIAQFVKH